MAHNSRPLLIVLAILLVLGVGTAFFAIRDAVNDRTTSMVGKTACDLLTLEEAKELLNDTAHKNDSSGMNNKETIDLDTTHCNYVTQGQGMQDTRAVNLELRASKTDAGTEKNASYFPPHNTDGQQVAGYGSEALWDAYSGKLSVLKDGNYFLVSMTKGLGGETATLAEVQKVAEAVGLKD